MTLSTALQDLGALFFLVSVVCSITSQILYVRLPGARFRGFGFVRYFYGEMRQTHPRVFLGSIGGVVVGMLLMTIARSLR